jgi:hypothetical protein
VSRLYRFAAKMTFGVYFEAIRPPDVNLLTFSNVAARWFMRRECFRFD